MKPSAKYAEIMQRSDFNVDQAQQQAVLLLDDLSIQIQRKRAMAQKFWPLQIFGHRKTGKIVEGIYFWGGVGRGKTFLLDIFYQCLPQNRKARLHFHDFMYNVHQDLKKQSQLADPLKVIAETLAASIDVLCLDEFVVTDIADAMLMGGLLKSLLAAGVVLVTTSNLPPHHLYRDGLQRARFLPAIDLIKQHCQVVHLDSDTDYRLQGLPQTYLYQVPHSAIAETVIQRYLKDYHTALPTNANYLTINDRKIAFRFCAGDTIWFSFATLCKTNRSQADYLAITRLFNTLILTDIEVMSEWQDDVVRRFVLLIDVIYDHRLKLICTAAAAVENLYRGKRLAFEFERTRSRLIEMQSQQYLARSPIKSGQ